MIVWIVTIVKDDSVQQQFGFKEIPTWEEFQTKLDNFQKDLKSDDFFKNFFKPAIAALNTVKDGEQPFVSFLWIGRRFISFTGIRL